MYSSTCVSTVDPNGFPDSRMMNIKRFKRSGIIFTTPLKSSKAIQLKANPNVALNFYWLLFQSEVRILGVTQRVTDQEADEIFHNQERWLHEMVWTTTQSEPIIDPALNEQRYFEIREY